MLRHASESRAACQALVQAATAKAWTWTSSTEYPQVPRSARAGACDPTSRSEHLVKSQARPCPRACQTRHLQRVFLPSGAPGLQQLPEPLLPAREEAAVDCKKLSAETSPLKQFANTKP